MKRTKLFALLAAFIVALGIFAASAFAADPAPSLSIKTFNLSVENAVYMVFKVADESVETDDMRLLVWENVPEAYKKGIEDACLTSNEVESGTGYTVFRYTDLAAKDMTKTVYALAYGNVNGTDVFRAPVKYSIVMYADMKKTASDPDEDLVAFLDTMLAYGAAAQTYFGHNTGFLATDEVHKVTVVNGTLADGFSLGWVKAGTTVTVTANAPAEGYVFSHWADATGASVATTETAELPVDKVETYTAVYEIAPTEGLVFAISDDETYYSVTGYTGSATEVVIPATYKGLPVKEIDVGAFYNEDTVTSVTIPDSVTSISTEAFAWCTSLTSVTIGASVTSIGNYAFYCCGSLTSVTIPDSVTSIGDFAFQSCDSFTSVTIPDSVTSIGNSAFWDCDSVTSVTIPDSVTSIGNYAFRDCDSVTNITVDAENPNYSSIDGNLYNKDATTLIQYAIGKTDTSFAIPDSVTSIGDYAFYRCTSLTSVTIGDGVTSIGDYAFFYCNSLTSVTFDENSQLTSIGKDAFYYCTSLTTVYYGGVDAEAWSEITIGANNDSLTNATRYYYSETQPTVEGNFWHYDENGAPTVWEILADDFYTEGLVFTLSSDKTYYSVTGYTGTETTVVIPSMYKELPVTSIGDYAFSNCTNLMSVTIPDSVTSIGNYAFFACRGLLSATIPSSVTNIGDYAFQACSSLTSVTFGENSNLKSIGVSAFFICRSLKNIAIPEGVTSIGSYAFDSCSFTSIAIPDSVTDIGYCAFNDCAKLTNIKLSNNITTLYMGTFSGCKSLIEIVIPDSVIAMANDVFSGCTSLTSITIPENVERFGQDVFKGCTGLKSVTFEVTKGWSVSANGYTESGTAVTVTNSANNATYLTDTYRTYYWKRTE